jgi:hypothetical protein
MADETRQIQVLMGPYRDNRLTVSAADADAAINAHWAVDPFHVAAPDEEPHPPLSDEERTAALEAATAWAKQTWDTAQGVTPPPDPPITRAKKPEEKRDMTPDEPSGRYTTRDKR